MYHTVCSPHIIQPVFKFEASNWSLLKLQTSFKRQFDYAENEPIWGLGHTFSSYRTNARLIKLRLVHPREEKAKICRGIWAIIGWRDEDGVFVGQAAQSSMGMCHTRHCEPYPTVVFVSFFNPFFLSPAYLPFCSFLPSSVSLSLSLVQHGLTFPEQGGLWWNVCCWLSHGVRGPSLPGGRRQREEGWVKEGREGHIGSKRLVWKGPQVRREGRILSYSKISLDTTFLTRHPFFFFFMCTHLFLLIEPGWDVSALFIQNLFILTPPPPSFSLFSLFCRFCGFGASAKDKPHIH